MVGKRVQFNDDLGSDSGSCSPEGAHLSAARRRGLCGASAQIWSAGKGCAQRERRSAWQEAALMPRQLLRFAPILPVLSMGGLEG